MTNWFLRKNHWTFLNTERLYSIQYNFIDGVSKENWCKKSKNAIDNNDICSTKIHIKSSFNISKVGFMFSSIKTYKQIVTSIEIHKYHFSRKVFAFAHKHTASAKLKFMNEFHQFIKSEYITAPRDTPSTIPVWKIAEKLSLYIFLQTTRKNKNWYTHNM